MSSSGQLNSNADFESSEDILHSKNNSSELTIARRANIPNLTKTIFISGGSSGIGLSLVNFFLKKEWRVLTCSRQEPKIRENMKGNFKWFAIDLKNRDDITSLKAKLTEENEEIHVLINNAGIFIESLNTSSNDNWEELIQVNLSGTIRLTRALLPFLKMTKGTILNIGSYSAYQTYTGGSIYSASKAGLDAWSRGLNLECKRYQVKVTLINPNFVWTPLLENSKKIPKDICLRCDDIVEVIWTCLQYPFHIAIERIDLKSVYAV
jgi:short-subunit dehydrogenase